VGIIGSVFGILIILFTRGHPNSYGYATVNVNSGERVLESDVPIRERFRILWQNLKLVVANGNFWLCSAWSFVVNGPFTSLNAYWGGPLLRDVFHFSKVATGNILMGLSLGVIVGCLTTPTLSDWLRTRKWLCFASTVVAAATQIPLLVCPDTLGRVPIFIILFIFAYFTNPLSHVLYAMVREYYVSAVAGTAVGCINTFQFLGGAVDELITGAILGSFGTVPGTSAYSRKAYSWSLLGFALGNFAIGLVLISLTKDTDFGPRREDNEPGLLSEEEAQANIVH
jgi:sugar phosphate permease